MWINNHLMHVVGDTVFVVRVLNVNTGDERVLALDQPARCASTGQPIIRGWAGEINSRSIYALGVAKVVGESDVLFGEEGNRKRVARVLEGEDPTGPATRIELQTLEKQDLRDELDRLGYGDQIDNLLKPYEIRRDMETGK